MNVRATLLTFALFAVATAPARSAPAVGSDVFVAASDGRGTITLLWYPAPSRLVTPSFRLYEAKGGVERVVADRIVAADPSYANSVSRQDFAFASKLAEALRQARAKGKSAVLAPFIALKVFGDFPFAQAAGFARTLHVSDAGPRRYRVVELDANGAASSISFTSPAVDPAVASAPVPPPLNVHAKASAAGIELGWAPPTAGSAAIVLAYNVQRGDTDVTPIPVISGTTWKTATQFVDRGAPQDTDLTYRVTAIDALGRRSVPSAPVSVYAMDVRALEPVTLTVRQQGTSALVTWSGKHSRHLAGYVVQRGMNPAGPYDTLTPRGLDASTMQYVDATPSAGTTYFYRVSGMSPRGDLGPPSSPAILATARGKAPPPPTDVYVAGGATRVRLTWRDPSAPIAGAEVERLDARGRWIRVTQTPVVSGTYDDVFGRGGGNAVSYRIVALGRDGQRSAPSAVATARLLDGRVPGRTLLAGAHADGEAVHLRFAGPRDGPPYTLAVYRSRYPRMLGIPVAQNLSATTRTYDDQTFTPGVQYAYRVVAVGANGGVGEPSDPVIVTGGARRIPAPGAPSASFATAPFKHVELRFAKPPAGLLIAVLSVDGRGRTRRVAWDVGDDHAMDARPVRGKAVYKLAYTDRTGRHGAFSPAVELSVP